MGSELSPDDKRLFELLCGLGLEPSEAFTFVQELNTMAAANLIARFENKLDGLSANVNAKLDAQNAKLDARLDGQNARLDGQNAKLDALRWVIGLGFAGLGILLAVFRLLG